jgi:hypothetical protein
MGRPFDHSQAMKIDDWFPKVNLVVAKMSGYYELYDQAHSKTVPVRSSIDSGRLARLPPLLI